MNEEKKFIEIEFRVIETDGDEYRHYRKLGEDVSDTGYADMYFLYERFREFLMGFGFKEEHIDKRIKYIDEEDKIG